MRVLITGAKGQLGRELVCQIKDTGWTAIPTDVQDMDITNQSQTIAIIRQYQPDAVIHCGAYTNVDGSETDVTSAYRVNALGTQNVAAACLAVNAKMVYISTDYVFDGMLGRAYSEFDQPNPLSIYGKSKYAGERLAAHILNRLFIVRTAWLYGDGSNFVRTMLRLAHEGHEIKVVDDQAGSPTNARDLAGAIIRLIPTDCYGIYHGVNSGVATWFEFARKIFKFAGYDKVRVLPQKTVDLGRPAPRPAYAPLESRMLALATGYRLRDWEAALRDYIKRYIQ
ncbi:MAG: dTDP-4-dehydrorhamnose reductase [Negativicutes bacterium]|nr:dTDP-4-dehydrorhamnose reductase [Negativicutes bacterium]